MNKLVKLGYELQPHVEWMLWIWYDFFLFPNVMNVFAGQIFFSSGEGFPPAEAYFANLQNAPFSDGL